MKKEKKVLTIFMFAVWISLVSLNGGQENKPFFNEYKIGAKDLLEIRVFELPELNQTVRVSEDGSITLPLVGKLLVSGSTQIELEKKLAEALEEKYVQQARVSVFIKEYQSSQVVMIGAVSSPGMFELVGRLNLLQLISKAGGLTENAAGEIIIQREGKNGHSATLAIELEDLMYNGEKRVNIPLMPNDVINIPKDDVITIYVFGKVKSPGAMEVKKSEHITLLRAIAQAGGPTEGSSRSNVTILRKEKDGKERKIVVNLKDILKRKRSDIVLQKGDVIYVPESFF